MVGSPHGEHGKKLEKKKMECCYVQSVLDDSYRRIAEKEPCIWMSTIGIFRFFIACVAFETALRLRMAAYDQTITKFVSKPVAQNETQILLDHHA